MMQTAPPELYMNMQQFSKLKLAARQDSVEASRAVSQQFEGLFVQMMLKNMRSAATVDPAQHSSYMDFYRDMYDKQLALNLSRQGGIGIADMMQRQLQPQQSQRQGSADPVTAAGKALPSRQLPLPEAHTLPMQKMNYQAENPRVKAHQLRLENAISPSDQTPESMPAAAKDSGHTQVTGTQPTGLKSQALTPFYGWQQADDFVSGIWQHARQAASKLGVSAQVLVAQSALETGWGKHAMRRDDGSIAFNLFGIKAGADWVGQSVTRNTLEFRSGAMQQESARFRAYDSLADAFADYVDFVQSRPRYAAALQHQGSDSHYVRGLQQAGYATDPNYARKIENIMRGDTLKQALALTAPQGGQYA